MNNEQLNAEAQRRRERYKEKKPLRLRVSAFKLDKDMLSAQAFSGVTRKYFLCYPKEASLI